MATSKKTTSKKVTKQSTKKTITKPESLGTCFVMMPFKDPFGVYYQSIFKPAIIKANLDPFRADDLFRPSVIVSDLWQMIQKAKILLAELTTKNANVFYELGLAHAIGKPIVLVSETMEDVPFDLQQLRVLLYDKDDPAWGQKLSDSITKAINETIANPIEAVPSIFRKTVPSQAPEQDATAARLDDLESQVRMLTRQISPRRSTLRPGTLDLISITDFDELIEWLTKRLTDGIPLDILLNAINRSDHIPDSWVREVLKRF